MPEWKKQIIDYLKEHESVTPIELSSALDILHTTAKQNLTRLTKEGILNKVGYGKYTLNQSY